MDLPTTHYDQPTIAKEAKVAEKVAPTVSRDSILTTISFYIFLACVFFAPLVFIPSVYAPLDLVKTIFLSLGILVASLFYAIGNMKRPTIVLPHYPLGYVTLGVGLSILLSSILSGNFSKSFFGQGFELGTASFLLIMFLGAYLVSRIAIRDPETVFKVYTIFYASFVLVALFHIIRLFGGDILNVGILGTTTATILGKWYDFAILTAAAGLLSFISIKFLPLRKGLKRMLIGALVVCGILLFIINATFVWAVLAIVMVCIGAYEYSTRVPKGAGVKAFFSRISILTVLVFVIATVLAWKGDTIALPAVKALNVEYVEAVLPWQLTLDVASDTLKESPFFGAGPNRFGSEYLRFKPLSVNQTQFWNAEFASGFALVPTFVATQGFVGVILWILFFIFLIREGIRALRTSSEPLSKFLLSSAFFIALFFWIITFIYNPSHVTVFLAFVFSGLFIAALVRGGVVKEKELKLTSNTPSSKIIPIASAACVVLLVIWLGAEFKKTAGIIYFQKGIKELNVTKSLDKAEKSFKRALTWDSSDVYYQALSEINILRINEITRQMEADVAKGASADQKKIEQVVALITDSVKYSKQAEKIDPTNYYNYIAEARISELGSSLQIPNAYENAKAAYINALKTNPYNPAIYLSYARLEASQNKLSEAEQAVGRSLQLKPNYTEAIFFLSQLQVAGNKLNDAIVSTKVALGLTPNEPLLHFQLGLLQYNNKDYTTAITALEKAVSLNNQYANARYFLGLAYARMGNTEGAITQFEELAKTNPDNKEVSFILKNLREGRSPFADAQPPIDSKPEKRKTLPVTEKSTAKKAS